jgi:hypothetical protein
VAAHADSIDKGIPNAFPPATGGIVGSTELYGRYVAAETPQ